MVNMFSIITCAKIKYYYYCGNDDGLNYSNRNVSHCLNCYSSSDAASGALRIIDLQFFPNRRSLNRKGLGKDYIMMPLLGNSVSKCLRKLQ